MATFTVTLAKDATTLELPGPEAGTAVRSPGQYVTGQTVNRTRYAYKTNASTKESWTINLVGLSATQKAALHSFFFTTVGGPGVSFSYTHTTGTAYSAQFVSTELTWVRRSSEQWDVTLLLETAGTIS